MNTPLFIVLFTDNDIYYGKKDYIDCGWKEIPNKSIKKIFFRLPTGDYLILADYSNYYHYVEVVKVISGTNAGKLQIQSAHILGKRNERIIEYKINILTGNTEVKVYDEDNQYVKTLNPSGWTK
jgi:hypothetical protein